MNTKFRASSWFTRGWTLQELLAPERSRIFFFDAKWTSIGSLEDLLDDVVDVTGITRPVLSRAGMRHYNSCVAQIMSWASQRRTSRGEDIAYCLLGLFDVSMPLLYGEGAANAFNRLQVEIMQRNDDESLFAWTSKRPASGALASSPACFADSKDIFRGQNRMNRRPYSMTNKRLEFSVPSRHLKHLSHDPTRFVVHLDCFRRIDNSNPGEDTPVALHLLGRLVGDRYVACRKPCNTLEDPGDLKTGRLDDELLPEELRTIYIE
ncbi:MAG: hypothetical protein LQ339_004249 [Xanthoria mediterranea]|nr:MAG: hypothetical protein LQ339_004249 [Xanthoria mediterranea]